MQVINVQAPKTETAAKGDSKTGNSEEFSRELTEAIRNEKPSVKGEVSKDSGDENDDAQTQVLQSMFLSMGIVQEAQIVEVEMEQSVSEIGTIVPDENIIVAEELMPEDSKHISSEFNRSFQRAEESIETTVKSTPVEDTGTENKDAIQQEPVTNGFVQLASEDNTVSKPVMSDRQPTAESDYKILSVDTGEVPVEDVSEVSSDKNYLSNDEDLSSDKNTDKNLSPMEQKPEYNLLGIRSSEPEKNTVKPGLDIRNDSPSRVDFNDNLQKINDTIVKMMETGKDGNAEMMKVKLFPEELGEVNIALKMEAGKLTARIQVDNDVVKALFTEKLNELNSNLVKQNIRLDSINVDLNMNSGNHNSFNFQESFNQQRGSLFRKNQPSFSGTSNLKEAARASKQMVAGTINVLA